MGIELRTSGGIAEVVIDFPPVNALTGAPAGSTWPTPSGGLGADADVRVVVVCRPRAAASTPASTSRRCSRPPRATTRCIGANRGCFAAFAAVYECEVPVIAAVHGFCLGGGIGLVGNADIVIASDDATFGLPEVDRGALGAATHLARLVPQHRMRAMVYTGRTRHGRRAARTTARCSRSCRGRAAGGRAARSPARSPPRARR